jgi:hypothetical protein
MNTIFAGKVKLLKTILNRFDGSANDQKRLLLLRLAKNKLPSSKTLTSYFEALLFICAFPPDKKTLVLAEQELLRISSFLKKAKMGIKKQFANSGLPFTPFVSCFSYDCVQWLIIHADCTVSVNKFENARFDLNEVLQITLPTLERSETTAGLGNAELLEALMVKKEKHLHFFMNELQKLDVHPDIKEHLYSGLGIHIDIVPLKKEFSRSYNRIVNRKVFFHSDIIKDFDHQNLLDSKIGDAVNLSAGQKKKMINVVKNAMALKDRETDPVTYLDENSFRLYELDRGIAVAVYGIQPFKQMPLESYVGYTLFKNGFPAVYGGGWVFGRRSDFGINIFETFRGGESGYMLCQLLRVYRQVFGVDHFEIEAYQFGLDNPEGIESGAFWFYYRYGFRPKDKKLLKLANDESAKITARKNYRTGHKTLIKFTASNMALILDPNIQPGVYDIAFQVMHTIRVKYKGNRLKAERDCVKKFTTKTGLHASLNEYENQVLKEVAIWAEACKITDARKLNLLVQMVKVKPVDLYHYQQLLLAFF